MISEADTDKYLAEILDILEERFNAGDKSALLYAIYHCLLMKRPLPEWLRAAFLHTYEARARFEIRSWDEVFGRPVPKSTHLEDREAKCGVAAPHHRARRGAEGGEANRQGPI
jgi:hypothetical protein